MIEEKIIEDLVYNLCVEANTKLSDSVVSKLIEACDSETNVDAKQALALILKNAQMSYEKKMPLCQDTGQVLVFLKIGSKFRLDLPENLKEIINRAVSKAYEDNFYRKSVVKNAVFDRSNTKTNAPCIIYEEFVEGCDLTIEILLKGAGSENVSVCSMLSPTSTEDEICDYVVSAVKKAGAKACPPYFIGVGIGGTIEYAGLMSKKALLLEENIDENHKNLAEKIKNKINDLNIGAAGLGGPNTALDVKILTDFTHIACLPVAVTINCHSSRHAKGVIGAKCKVQNAKCEVDVSAPLRDVFDEEEIQKRFQVPQLDFSDFIKVDASDIDKLKSLKQGQKILLSGDIYTARDMAHKRLVDMIKNGEQLPFDIENSIIFYAGPCPAAPDCVVGSIGPTTSSRMDKFAPILYKEGVLATIGKGERSLEVEQYIKENNKLYFTVIGGIACYLSDKFVEKELMAFEDLGTEAICRFKVKDLPLRLAIA